MVEIFHRDSVEFDYNFIFNSKTQINIKICAQPHIKVFDNSRHQKHRSRYHDGVICLSSSLNNLFFKLPDY